MIYGLWSLVSDSLSVDALVDGRHRDARVCRCLRLVRKPPRRGLRLVLLQVATGEVLLHRTSVVLPASPLALALLALLVLVLLLPHILTFLPMFLLIFLLLVFILVFPAASSSSSSSSSSSLRRTHRWSVITITITITSTTTSPSPGVMAGGGGKGRADSHPRGQRLLALLLPGG